MRRRAARIEPWFARLQAALRRRRTPQIYLLVSLADAQRLARGRIPPALGRQVQRLLAWTREVS